MVDQKALQAIEEETKCSICTCTYSDAHLLNCGHTYCGSCILMWLQQKKSCPKCRVPAIRQPVPVLALQNICDLLRPENVIKEKKMCRADWEDLYPVENQSGYIRDVDQDGTIHRCSNCGWELDEDNYCGNCMIHYDNGSVVNDNESDYNMQSDAGSHMEPEEDLDDFVVDDGQVDYEDVIHDSILDEDDDMEPVVRKQRKRKRVINLSEDEDDNVYERPIIIADDDDDDDDDDNNDQDDMSNGEVEMTYGNNDHEEEEEEEEDDYSDEFPEDVFSRPKRSIYIDDAASEDDDEVEEIKPKKVDMVLDTIAKAQDRMKRSTPVNKESSSSSSSSDDSEDEPDYNLVP
ncbi:hypothetical protein MFLAVUS_000753 [Mucor flavus]|uniref:RING-type domain-containing protein n=1 Tax=Mucor flavus TaxID=439312 RepID=A0ABP9YKM7_9FUNG